MLNAESIEQEQITITYEISCVTWHDGEEKSLLI